MQRRPWSSKRQPIRERYALCALSAFAIDLKRPIYQDTAAYGHFGREDDSFTWEKVDQIENLKS